jgi:lysozyme
MNMTKEGLALIKRYEGLRVAAYQDAAGVWTIGYGHTSMAGAPDVRRGMTISDTEAEAIFARDVAEFANAVAKVVKVELSPAQFSALVSFAYNVGIGGLKKSSVLAAINAGDFEAVPRRLNLWIKAGGRVLPGLVKRRAAEAALFMSENHDASRQTVTPMPGKPVHESRTIWSAAAVMLLSVVQTWLSLSLKLATIALVLAIALGLGLIVYERYKKLKLEGV